MKSWGLDYEAALSLYSLFNKDTVVFGKNMLKSLIFRVDIKKKKKSLSRLQPLPRLRSPFP